MDNYTQKNRNISIAVKGLGADDLLLTQVKGHEGLSELFSYKLGVLGVKGVTSETIIGNEATVKLVQDDGGVRYFNGIITRFACHGKYKKAHDLTSCVAILSPKLWLLQRNRRCRVFNSQSVVDIVTSVLKEWNILYDDTALDLSSIKTLEHCVQYHESDFHFISRIIEEVGIFYHFEHSYKDGTGYHKMILLNKNPGQSEADNNDNQENSVPGLTYAPAGEGSSSFYYWQMADRIGYQELALDDYNYEDSQQDYLKTQKSLQKTALSDAGNLKYTNYLGRFRNVENRDSDMSDYGTLLAKIDMQITKSRHCRWAGKTKHTGITPGMVFTLKDFPDHDSIDCLVKRAVVHAKTSPYQSGHMHIEKDDHFAFDCFVAAQDISLQFSAPKRHKLPRVHSIERAVVVTDSSDPDLTCDQYGRVKICFKWSAGNDDDKTYWARTLSASAGSNFGQVMLPTKGQEVMVCFENGDPDYPIIIGSVYNDQNMPPVKLDDPKLKFANITRGRTVDSNGDFVDNIDSANVESYPAIMNVDDLNSSANRKQFNEISVYNMQSSFKEQGWPAGDSAYVLRAVSDMFGGDLSSTAISEDIGLLEEVADNTKKDSFEGINLYSNNQILAQAAQDHVVQAGRNVVIEAGNSLVLKVGRSTITMRDAGITIRESCMTTAKPLWELKDATGHIRTFDSVILARPMEAQVYATYSYLTAFVSNAVDTPWGASYQNTLFNACRYGTVIKDTAGGAINLIVKLGRLASSLYGCIPENISSDITGDPSSSSKFYEGVHCATSAMIIGTIIKLIYQDMKYFLTLKSSEFKITPKNTLLDSGNVEIKGNPAKLNGNPLAGYDVTLATTAGIDLTEEDDLIGSNLIVNTEEIANESIDQSHLVLGDLEIVADTRSEQILNDERLAGDSSEQAMARDESYVEHNVDTVERNEEVASGNVVMADRTEETGALEENTGVLTQDIGAREAVIGADIETG